MCTYFWKRPRYYLSGGSNRTNTSNSQSINPKPADVSSLWSSCITFCMIYFLPSVLIIATMICQHQESFSAPEITVTIVSLKHPCLLTVALGCAFSDDTLRVWKQSVLASYFLLTLRSLFSVPPSLKTTANKMDNPCNSVIINILSLHIIK